MKILWVAVGCTIAQFILIFLGKEIDMAYRDFIHFTLGASALYIVNKITKKS